MTISDLARHLDRLARIAATTARYLNDLDKEIER